MESKILICVLVFCSLVMSDTNAKSKNDQHQEFVFEVKGLDSLLCVYSLDTVFINRKDFREFDSSLVDDFKKCLSNKGSVLKYYNRFYEGKVSLIYPSIDLSKNILTIHTMDKICKECDWGGADYIFSIQKEGGIFNVVGGPKRSMWME